MIKTRSFYHETYAVSAVFQKFFSKRRSRKKKSRHADEAIFRSDERCAEDFFYFGAVATDYFAVCNFFDGVKNFFRSVDDKRVEIICSAQRGVGEMGFKRRVNQSAFYAAPLEFADVNAHRICHSNNTDEFFCG